jgi:hypothetical protein
MAVCPSPWLDAPPEPTPPLRGDQRVDVAVVGTSRCSNASTRASAPAGATRAT